KEKISQIPLLSCLGFRRSKCIRQCDPLVHVPIGFRSRRFLSNASANCCRPTCYELFSSITITQFQAMCPRIDQAFGLGAWPQMNIYKTKLDCEPLVDAIESEDSRVFQIAARVKVVVLIHCPLGNQCS